MPNEIITEVENSDFHGCMYKAIHLRTGISMCEYYQYGVGGSVLMFKSQLSRKLREKMAERNNNNNVD